MNPTAPSPLPSPRPPQRPRTRSVLVQRLGLLLRIAQVRLRFLVVLGVSFLIVGQWHVIRNYWDTWTSAVGPAKAAISADTEYFCPMDPGVVSAWPSKCSICNMALVRRQKGEAVTLPDGVVARMQLSPYRMQLAGVETSVVGFLPLKREVTARGNVVEHAGDSEPPRALVEARVGQRDAVYLHEGQEVSVVSDAGDGRPPLDGRIVELAASMQNRTRLARVEVDDPRGELLARMRLTLRARIALADLEPMRSQPTDPPPLAAGETRQVYICPDHADVVAVEEGTCPADDNELLPQELALHQRLAWWCPMHPEVRSGQPGGSCEQCQGMKLVPRIDSYRPAGEVLAVPESAVVDTGHRQVVYVQTGPGMFDGVEVALAERSGGYYAVVSGLEAGQRVVTSGAFLIDAETRLNPRLATAYFGAGRAPAAGGSDAAPAADGGSQEEEIRQALSELSSEDRKLAAEQKVCPVTGLALGSMGKPPAVEVGGRRMLICCAGCEAALAANPKKYLDPPRKNRRRSKSGPQAP